MAKATLSHDRWTRNTIISASFGPTKNKDGKIAKHGLIEYTQNKSGTIYEWEIRPDSDLTALKALQVGETYRVYLKAITHGRLTGYDWAKIRPVNSMTAPQEQTVSIHILNPELFSEPEQQPKAQPSLREDILALLMVIAQQDISDEVETLVSVVGTLMAEDEDLFK